MMMKILTSVITDLDQESLEAKAYWQKPGTQTLLYRSRSHYVDAILKIIIESEARKILEFGCGSGRNLSQIHKELSSHNNDLRMHLRGIDTNVASIEFGRKKFSSDLDLVLGDEKTLADEPNIYYDLVYTVSVLDHLPNPVSIVKDMLSKTRRFAIFLEPVIPVGRGAEGKLETISTKWWQVGNGESTPFTYFHSYPSIFREVGANVLIDIPMPTSVYKVGPFYRFYLVEKKDFDKESGCRISNLSELSDGIIQEAILSLSSSLRYENSNSAKHIKSLQSAKISIQEANAELQQEKCQVTDLKHELQSAKISIQEANAELQSAKIVFQEALAQNSSILSAMQDSLADAISESGRLLAINQAMSNVSLIEARNALSCESGRVLMQGSRSLESTDSYFGIFHKIWRNYKTKRQTSILSANSFEAVILAYRKNGLKYTDQILNEAGIVSRIKADAYTALARHLRKLHPIDAGEAARLAYEADPRLFRRKWLVFRLSEANRVLEAEALLATLPLDTQFSVSESMAIEDIRGRALDERQIAAQATVERFLSEIAVNHQTNPLLKCGGLIQFSTIKPDDYYVKKYRTEGVDAIRHEIHHTYADRKKIGANEFIRAAKVLRDAGIPEAEYPLIKAAKELYTNLATLRAFFWAAQREKEFSSACDAIHEIEKMLGPNMTAEDAEKLRRMKASPAYQLTVLRSVEPKKGAALDSVPKRVCYVLHNSLPYSSGGYATRSQGVAEGMLKAGLDVISLTRPGFPLDIKPELNPDATALSEEIEGIRYMRILNPQRRSKSMLNYVLEAADSIEEKLRELRPEVVMAASNHVTGLPALIAARRLGLKFIYEVRGLWEITRMSREPAFEDTSAFAVQSLLEASVCREADCVFTLTGPMRDELIRRGVNAEKITLLPNSCNPEYFSPEKKNIQMSERLRIPFGVPVIGYIGTFVEYEGLDDLAYACGLLKEEGKEFRLLLVGNENASGEGLGPISVRITEIAKESGFSDWLIMTGRVPHEEVRAYYSLIDIAPFPRKPYPVCEMVSPMKPLEAMAMGKAVVVSNVTALQEMIIDGITGCHFDKGDVSSLARALKSLIDKPELRNELGQNAREWVSSERTWHKVGQILSENIAFERNG